MKRFNLQLFAEFTAVQGNKLVYLYRVYEDRATDTGATLAYTRENSRSVDTNAEDVETKDGKVRVPGSPNIQITARSYLKKNDEQIPKLEAAMLNDKLMEVWETNLEEPGETEGKFKGIYYQGYLTNMEKSSPSGEYVEVSLTFTLNGKGATGDVTVTAEQQAEAAYVFADTTATGATGTT